MREEAALLVLEIWLEPVEDMDGTKKTFTSWVLDLQSTSMTNINSSLEYYMARAINLAKHGLLTTRPNPIVGCVIENQGHIVGEGWHQKAGEAHAEVNALVAASDQAKGGTAFVTLEPCSHYGRTPPCCEALVKHGISKVVVGSRDPNPLVAGKGIEYLKSQGIEVVEGVLKEECDALNTAFFHKMSTDLPRVICKMAASIDGRTALKSGESQWISGLESRADVHYLRAKTGAILTTVKTVNDDDSLFNLRHGLEAFDDPLVFLLLGEKPLKLSSRLRLEKDRVITIGTGLTGVAGLAHIQVDGLGPRTDLLEVIRAISNYPVNEILVEAGATFAGELVKQSLVDEFIFYLAPKLLGNTARSMFECEVGTLEQAPEIEISHIAQLGNDIKITALPLKGCG